MRKAMDMVAEFHRKHGAPELDRVATPAEIAMRRALRMRLIDEEANELREALGLVVAGFAAPDPVAVAAALAGLAYVTIGAALEWGIPLDRVFAEVHRSNMTKTPGKVRGDGKILKGEGYEPPRIGEVLAGATECTGCAAGHPIVPCAVSGEPWHRPRQEGATLCTNPVNGGSNADQ